ncbi:MAG: Uma2 family endonuclease [Methylothermaceae bacterium]|nr:Uma2 family endonuclease [Methylothermaceae bacterium]
MGEAGILSEDDRVELINGEIIDMAPIGNRHTTAVRKLIHFLSSAIRGKALLDVQNPILLGERSEPQPDITLLRIREDFYAEKPPAPEDVLLLMEVSDTSSSYDRSIKMPLYAEHGIREAWLIDLEKKTVEIFREPSPEGYRETKRIGSEESIRPSLCPEVKIELSKLFSGL